MADHVERGYKTDYIDPIIEIRFRVTMIRNEISIILQKLHYTYTHTQTQTRARAHTHARTQAYWQPCMQKAETTNLHFKHLFTKSTCVVLPIKSVLIALYCNIHDFTDI